MSWYSWTAGKNGPSRRRRRRSSSSSSSSSGWSGCRRLTPCSGVRSTCTRCSAGSDTAGIAEFSAARADRGLDRQGHTERLIQIVECAINTVISDSDWYVSSCLYWNATVAITYHGRPCPYTPQPAQQLFLSIYQRLIVRRISLTSETNPERNEIHKQSTVVISPKRSSRLFAIYL